MLLFIDLLKQPWFALSPSPFSIAFYIICGILGARRLLNVGFKFRFGWLFAFVDALLVLGLVILIQDSMWLSLNTVKWIIPMYSGIATFWNYYVRFPQNILGALLLFFVTSPLFLCGFVKFTRKTVLYLSFLFGWLVVQFYLAPNQAFTDWMFAVRYGFEDWIILLGFSLNVLMKIVMGLCFLSMFKIEQCLKRDQNITSKGV